MVHLDLVRSIWLSAAKVCGRAGLERVHSR